jgi:hypothetical protein
MRTYAVNDRQQKAVENAIDAIDGDPDEPDVDRSRGRAPEGSITVGEALARVAAAYTGVRYGE